MHPEKTRVVDVRTESFDFLGYSFRGQDHWPRKKSIQKLRAAIRQKTPRTTGRSMQCTIVDVNRTLKGWFGYFQHSSYKTVFNAQDDWVRQRLRSMRRHFLKRPGRARGRDMQRWPNARDSPVNGTSTGVALLLSDS